MKAEDWDPAGGFCLRMPQVESREMTIWVFEDEEEGRMVKSSKGKSRGRVDMVGGGAVGSRDSGKEWIAAALRCQLFYELGGNVA